MECKIFTLNYINVYTKLYNISLKLEHYYLYCSYF
ncbi:protein kinase [Schistosoma mansoni]|nr:protein kinase [Schistosoma mansoni]|eukprot:XP_018654235.1 protein kinase [Schistosoma mansoni]